jgi:branched-chain amino acid transport system ATP-binding protein
MNTELLLVNNLTVSYNKAEVVKSASFTVAEGKTVALIGSNGAGKTTILRTISRLVNPSGGEIFFRSKRIDQLEPYKVARMGIVHVPERNKIFPAMSVLENLLLSAHCQRDQKKISSMLKEVMGLFPALRPRKSQVAGTLSGGERQMLAIGCGLMASPKLLLLDEPSLGLAPILVAQISDWVKEINKAGITILLSEQNAHLAFGCSQWVYVFESGTVAVSGKPEELAKNQTIANTYIGT